MRDGDQHVGATIAGKYRIRRLIGVGGMGAVYEGQHIDLGKKVAIKIIDSAADTSAELAARFRREARAASAVESDGIVQVFDVGSDPHVGLYMVMELLQGEDLEIRLRNAPGRRLDPVVVAQIGYQVARALVKAHAARVIHRDLKPANIFLTDRDDGSLRVKILDFGISKLLAGEASSIAAKDAGFLQLTAAGVALGTPQYMSPEQAQGLTTVNHRCDVWGLGVVLYEALAGIPAFPDLGGYQDTILNLLRTQALPLASVAPGVPEALAKVVHAAIRHDVATRIQDCAAFATLLEEAMPEALVGATGPHASLVQRARLGSSPSLGQYPVPKRAATPPSVRGAAPLRMSGAADARPITLGGDTQVVVRASDPGVTYDEGDQTMLADGAPVGSAKGEPKIEIIGRAEPPSFSDDAPVSTGDPTMFQTPAWVERPNDGLSTLKTGLALGGAPPTSALRAPNQGIAALVTALVVIGVGGSILLLASRETPAEPAGSAIQGAAIETSPGPQVEPSPPATGAAIPMAPATGAVIVGGRPPEVNVDASTANATAESAR